jgi:hypothetical protein
MNSTPATPAGIKKPGSSPVPPPNHNVQSAGQSIKANQLAGPGIAPKPTGYGMPCARCKTYYAADLTVCPVCKSSERISPAVTAMRSTSPSVDHCPDPVELEEERERFLRDFKAKVFASQVPLSAGGNARCAHEENHAGGSEPPAVCQGCYDHLQERVDVLEAALHMDVKEAAQIVYDAVWADPSDATKTYENAAHALLAELRRRSGVTQVFGLLQPLSD